MLSQPHLHLRCCCYFLRVPFSARRCCRCSRPRWLGLSFGTGVVVVAAGGADGDLLCEKEGGGNDHVPRLDPLRLYDSIRCIIEFLRISI